MPRPSIGRRHLVLGVAALVVSALVTACSGAGGGSSGGAGTVNVLMVNNPQMVDLQKLTADNFTKQTGINVKFTVLPATVPRFRSPELVVVSEASPPAFTLFAPKSAASLVMLILPVPVVAVVTSNFLPPV